MKKILGKMLGYNARIKELEKALETARAESLRQNEASQSFAEEVKRLATANAAQYKTIEALQAEIEKQKFDLKQLQREQPTAKKAAKPKVKKNGKKGK